MSEEEIMDFEDWLKAMTAEDLLILVDFQGDLFSSMPFPKDIQEKLRERFRDKSAYDFITACGDESIKDRALMEYEEMCDNSQ